jgi:hypothetical protein
MGVNFDGWLENELSRGFEQVASRTPALPRYASLPALSGGGAVIHSVAALAKSKVAIAAATLTLAAGGVGAKAAITGNPNPFNWGHKVTNQVVACKQDLSPGQHGIGTCVSDFAKQHGAQVREEHSRAGSHPTGPPSSHPAGPTSSHPTGPPSSVP